MSEKTAKLEPPKPPDADPAFRRQAALAILQAYVAKHGGWRPEEREVLMRQVWDYADAFVALEHAPPLPAEAPPAPAPAGRGRGSPTDEWAVIDGETKVRGFVIYEEAEWYASARPGARIVKVGGPDSVGRPAVA